MNFQGLWTVSFSAAEEAHMGITVREDIERGGVLVLLDGRVYGGGISYYFTGTYTGKGSAIEMQVIAARYNEIVAGIFGAQPRILLAFSGSVAGEKMVLHGHVQGSPDKRMDVMAVRRNILE
jgi:hypothetical protein